MWIASVANRFRYVVALSRGGGGAEAVYRLGPGTHSFTGPVPRA